MTDEQRLTDMMANPGPAPTHDKHGWPAEMVGPTPSAMSCALKESTLVAAEVGMVYRVACRHGEWDSFEPRRALHRATAWHAAVPTRGPAIDSAGPAARRVLPRLSAGDVVEDERGARGTVVEAWAATAQVAWENDQHGPALEYVGDLRRVEDSAGPAPSCANPSGTGGPDPEEAAFNGWPTDHPPAPVMVNGEVHKPALFVPTSADQAPKSWVCRTCTDNDDTFMPVWPCDAVAEVYEAGATGGPDATAGVVGLLARLEADAAAIRRVAEEIEGRRRELWDAVVQAARDAEQYGGPVPGDWWKGVAQTWRKAYRLATSMSGDELAARLAVELDARYGTDRAKGGASDG